MRRWVSVTLVIVIVTFWFFHFYLLSRIAEILEGVPLR